MIVVDVAGRLCIYYAYLIHIEHTFRVLLLVCIRLPSASYGVDQSCY